MTNETRESQTHNVIILVIVMILAGFLVYRNALRNVEKISVRDTTVHGFWSVPSTHLGWLTQKIDRSNIAGNSKGVVLPAPVSYFHGLTNKTIHFLNGTRGWWWGALFVLMVTFGLLYSLLFKSKKKETHYVLYRMLTGACLIGILGHLAWAPVSTGLWLNLVSALFYLGGVVSLVAAMGNADNPRPKDRRRKVQYGPEFREPSTNGSGTLHVATYERTVLPEASRWAAKRGRWPVEIPLKKLSSGITILGEKGSGKSRLMFAIHDEIRARYPDVPILIHDPKGEWYRTYYDPKTDVVFGPNIDGSAKWDIWGDLKAHPEMMHGIINTAVYAHQSNGDTFWLDNAVRLLENAFTAPTLEAARDYLIAKKEANIDDKTFLSIYGTTKLALYDIVKVSLTKQAADDLSKPVGIDDYLKWKGRILLLNNPAFAAEQRGAFSLFLSAFLLRALSLPDVPAGQLRLVAFIDEALTFTLPPEVEKLIYTQCRSKGIVIIAGAQRLPEQHLKETGEWSTAEFIFAMKVLNLQTQSQMSKRAGDISYEEKTKSKQQDQVGQNRGASEVSHSRTHPALPPEMFGRLKNRECILYHDGGIAPCKTKMVEREQRDIPIPNYRARAEVFEFMKKLD